MMDPHRRHRRYLWPTGWWVTMALRIRSIVGGSGRLRIGPERVRRVALRLVQPRGGGGQVSAGMIRASTALWMHAFGAFRYFDLLSGLTSRGAERPVRPAGRLRRSARPC
jgi:hypothetical protein